MAKTNPPAGKKPAAPTDYEVGRGKTPEHTRFVKGRSGNPGGKKRGTRNLKTILEELARSEIRVNEGGRTRLIPAVEAVLMAEIQAALKGRLGAMENFLNRCERLRVGETRPQTELPEEDQEILSRALARQGRRGPASGPPASGSEEPTEDDAARGDPDQDDDDRDAEENTDE